MHAGSVDEWAAWLAHCRAGLRRPLGQDLLRRRYWALGGIASAWRVYCEDEGGDDWGFYDGVLGCLAHGLSCTI